VSSIDQDIAQFLHHLEFERGLSANTITSYACDLSQAASFLAELGIGDTERVRREHVAEHVAHMRRQGRASSSIARRLSALRAFFRFVQERRNLARNPAAEVDFVRRGRTIPHALSPEAVDRLLAAPRPDHPLGLRDRAMLELMYATGMRVSELVGVRLADLDVESRLIRCLGKGGKQRVVPLGRKAAASLVVYLQSAREAILRGRESPALFITSRGAPMSRVNFWKLIKRYAAEAGIRQRLTPHVLRHSFATHMLAGGAGIAAIRELLGHADIATTQIYTHVSREHMREEYRRAHPRSGRTSR
jgi:integrase/recombinase XerD